jgi:hypothetical protein
VFVSGIYYRLDCRFESALQTFWKIANMVRANNGWIMSRVPDGYKGRP